MRPIMHQGRRVARWRSIRGIRRPLAALERSCGDRLAGLRWRQVWIGFVHLMVVLPENKNKVVNRRRKTDAC